MPPYRPGTNVITEETAPPTGATNNTGTWFVAGLTEKGPSGPQLIQSMSDYDRIYGDWVSYGFLRDAAENYFNSQGSIIWMNRVVGPDAASATLSVTDAGNAETFTLNSKGPGASGNGIIATITVNAGAFTVVLTDGVTTETSPAFTTKADFFTWAMFSALVDVEDGASALIPKALPATHLAGGDDDRASITTDDWTAAFEQFDSSYGIGQVSAPGMTSDDIHLVIEDHCALTGRSGVLDAPNTADLPTLRASAGALAEEGDHSAIFAPWVNVGGAGGLAKYIPPSSSIAGLVARNDPIIGPNAPSAGGNGILVAASGLSQQWTDIDRQTLNAAGINVIRSMFQGRSIRVYGWRSLVAETRTNWRSFGNVRLRMALTAEGNQILENYMFDMIDGQGSLFNDLAGALAGMMMPYFQSRQLYGRTPDEAFRVNVGPQVNTTVTIANNEIHAVLSYRDSPFVEFAQLALVKVPTTLSV